MSPPKIQTSNLDMQRFDPVTRRSFLALAGLSAGAVALGSNVLSAEMASAASGYLWPNGTTTQPHVSSPYGMRDGRLHAGTDFTGFSTACAVAAGTVLAIGELSGWSAGGYQVYLQHSGFTSRYLHLAWGSARVNPGQSISAGTPLGAVGNTGASYGTHLHLEIAPPSGTVDPVPFLTIRINQSTTSTLTMEDHMIKISSPGRGSALIGPGYYRKLNTQEEIDQCAPLVSASHNGNDRQFDLWKSMALSGTAAAA